MTDFASYLPDLTPQYIDRPVLDSTDITGYYDFDLRFGKTNLATPNISSQNGATPGGGADVTDELTIFEAIDRTFGLKLEPQKKAMPTVRIEHLEPVTSDN